MNINNNTNCERCIFSDFASSSDPCKMNIIDQIKDIYNIEIKNKYFYIKDYRCKYGFDIDIYKEYKDKIGSLQDLENHLKQNNYIKYLLIIKLDDKLLSYLDKICDIINSLYIPPQFVCFFTLQNNETSKHIETISTKLNDNIKWKLNNFLFEQEFGDYISTIISTNFKKNDAPYFWINNGDITDKINENLININKIINIIQPKAQALIKNNLDWNGIFLSFDNYAEIVRAFGSNIIEGLSNLENKNLINYD